MEENESQQSEEQAGGEEQAEPTIADVMELVRKQADLIAEMGNKTDSKIRDVVKRVGKLNERTKAPEEKPAEQPKQPDMAAVRKLGRLQAQLPEELQGRVDEMEADIGTHGALTWAEAIIEGMSLAGGQKKTPTTKVGKPAGSPKPNDTAAPKTLDDLRNLAMTDAKRYKQVMELAKSGELTLPSQ